MHCFSSFTGGCGEARAEAQRDLPSAGGAQRWGTELVSEGRGRERKDSG